MDGVSKTNLQFRRRLRGEGTRRGRIMSGSLCTLAGRQNISWQRKAKATEPSEHRPKLTNLDFSQSRDRHGQHRQRSLPVDTLPRGTVLIIVYEIVCNEATARTEASAGQCSV